MQDSDALMAKLSGDKSYRSTPRLPPALKHGSYSTLSVLPGEDRAAFLKLHMKLIEEFRPDGPLEHNAVKTIADCIWRINHFTVFQRARLARAKYKLELNRPIGFNSSSAKNEANETPEEKHARLMDEARRWYESGETIMSVGATLRDRAYTTVKDVADQLKIDVSELLKSAEEEYELAWLGDIITLEKLKEELEILERLEARMSRAMKTLMQAKWVKQVISTTPGPRNNSGPSSTPAPG